MYDAETKVIDQIAIMSIRIVHGFIVFMSTAECIPEAIDPQEALAFGQPCGFSHIPIVIPPTKFKSARVALLMGFELFD